MDLSDGAMFRLERIERSHRNLKWAVLPLYMLVVVTMSLLSRHVITATALGGKVAAEEFLLTDSSGKVRAELRVWTGGSRMDLYGPDGQPQVAISTSNHGPALDIRDTSAHVRASITAQSDSARIALKDANERIRMDLAVTAEGPMLVLYDEEGKERAVLDQAGMLHSAAK